MTEQKSTAPNYFLGIFLILLGVLILLIQLDRFGWEDFWPLIIIAGGVLFILGFIFNRENYGLLMPGTILFITGVLFFYMTQSRWHYMENLWPTFVLAPGIGFFLMFLFGPKGNHLWIPGLILVSLALIFYAEFWYSFKFWPVLLIIIGIYLILSKTKLKKPSQEGDFLGENKKPN